MGRGVPVDRQSAASSAGLSVHQRKTALRVANVPEAEFEAAVESENPPSIPKLAEQRNFVLWWDAKENRGGSKSRISNLEALGIDKSSLHRWRTSWRT
jgi:hypothetical protein